MAHLYGRRAEGFQVRLCSTQSVKTFLWVPHVVEKHLLKIEKRLFNFEKHPFDSFKGWLHWLYLNHLSWSPPVLRKTLFVEIHRQGFGTVKVVEHVQDVFWG